MYHTNVSSFCCVQLDGTTCKWVPGGKSTLSLEGAEEQTAKNGDAPKRHSRILSTVRDICTEVKTVQESLWKF